MNGIQAIERIEKALDPAALFPPGRDADEAYVKLLKLVHPDRFEPAQRPRAEEAAKKLAGFLAQIKPATPQTSKVGKWEIQGPLCAGDLADLYLVEADTKPAVMKVARSATDNDLMRAEYAALAKMHTCREELREYWKYIPCPIDTFEASGRQATVFTRADGYLPLSSLAQMFPEGLPFRHIVWMGNRLLSVIGFAQREGWLHGGITPAHLLYHPKTHGLVLVGWCSVTAQSKPGHVPIMSNAWDALYPAEVRKKWPAHPGTDIYMAAKSLLYASERPPREFLSIFEHMTAESPSARPLDAWALQERWVERAKEVYGPAKYVELIIPVQ